VQAHIADAGLLVVATSDSTDVRPMMETARTLNPGIPVIVRAANGEEALLLLKEGARKAVHGKGALAEVMVRDVLEAIGTVRLADRPAQ
jgi:CPA2 family monovalent cation:H+ antiporter-2